MNLEEPRHQERAPYAEMTPDNLGETLMYLGRAGVQSDKATNCLPESQVDVYGAYFGRSGHEHEVVSDILLTELDMRDYAKLHQKDYEGARVWNTLADMHDKRNNVKYHSRFLGYEQENQLDLKLVYEVHPDSEYEGSWVLALSGLRLDSLLPLLKAAKAAYEVPIAIKRRRIRLREVMGACGSPGKKEFLDDMVADAVAKAVDSQRNIQNNSLVAAFSSPHGDKSLHNNYQAPTIPS